MPNKEYLYLENVFNKLNIVDEYKNIIEEEGFYKEFYFNKTHCVLKRNRMGVWCGYVALSKSHKDYIANDIENLYDVHGGITFFDYLSVDNNNLSGYKWIGFDCGHSNDISPTAQFLDLYYGDYQSRYRDLEYVKNELESLSLQVYNRSLSKKIKDILEKI